MPQIEGGIDHLEGLHLVINVLITDSWAFTLLAGVSTECKESCKTWLCHYFIGSIKISLCNILSVNVKQNGKKIIC